MSDQLTYAEAMALAKLVPFEVREPLDGKNTDLIFFYETINGNQHGRKFEPFDPRWCGVYIQWLFDKRMDTSIEWVFGEAICSLSHGYQSPANAPTPTEAVARTVLAVMREKRMVT